MVETSIILSNNDNNYKAIKVCVFYSIQHISLGSITYSIHNLHTSNTSKKESMTFKEKMEKKEDIEFHSGA